MSWNEMDVTQRFAAYAMEAATRREYLEVASGLLSHLIPNDAIAWIRVDFRVGSSEVSGTTTGLSDVDVGKLLLDVADDHPMVQSFLAEPSWAVARRMSDLVSDRELHSTRAFKELLEPVCGHHMLSVLATAFSPQGTRSWSLNRRLGDFSTTELDLLTRLQPTVALLDRAFADQPSSTHRAEQYGLTRREIEVMRLMGSGLTAVAIAHLLGISRRTVTKHLEHAYAKLDCSDRLSALRVAGLLPAP